MMHKAEFIEKYEFRIRFNDEKIEYLNYVLEVLKPFDNKAVSKKIINAVAKKDPATQKTTHWLIADSDYWYFRSNKNTSRMRIITCDPVWVYADYHITMIPTRDIVENNRLKYDKLKEALTWKINYLEEENSKYTSMLENLDVILGKLAELNNIATSMLSSIPREFLGEFVDLQNLGKEPFIRITE